MSVKLKESPEFCIAPDGKFELTSPMVVDWDGWEVEVPEGFLTDFASVPRGARPIFTGFDKTREPAIFHDYLYSKGGDIPAGTYTRKAADIAFKVFMIAAHVPKWKIFMMYRAVRGFGWLHSKWRK